jgi:AraC family transcriptional regulator of adaptative response/methylated-DNA-[protein]-cysteine methyltransferase
MASLNDNLFTNGEVEFGFSSRMGYLEGRFSKRGLSELAYCEEISAKGARQGNHQISAFKAWLDRFARADVAVRWKLLDLQGSDFRKAVWRRLLEIPMGETRTYGEIAREIGQASASRAVGSAVGANQIAVLVPCHRVVLREGGIGNYRWGVERKRALLDAERESGSALASIFF